MKSRKNNWASKIEAPRSTRPWNYAGVFYINGEVTYGIGHARKFTADGQLSIMKRGRFT